MIERDFVFQLRLHNALLYKGEICFVESISLDSNDESEPYINLFANGKTIECIVPHHQSEGVLQPIPITPEILEKAGFVKTTSYTKIQGIEIIDYRLRNFVLYVLPSGCEVEFAPPFAGIDERSHLCTIHHLHQLMNLFYALTGQDLEITL